MARKPNFVRKKKRKVHGSAFWDKEYTNPEYLKLSDAESQDLAKFTRWLMRRDREDLLQPDQSAVDAGCGNGRNLIFLNRTFDMHGVGVDISAAAISQAKSASRDLPITYCVGNAANPLPCEDGSQALALDMMTSHFLNQDDRFKLREEMFRTLKPGGFLFMKTFLKDGDRHEKTLTVMWKRSGTLSRFIG